MLEISEFIDDPVLDKVMSREAREVRDEVFMLSYKMGTSRMGNSDREEFIQRMVAQYDPINFERAVFYSRPRQIIEAIYRATSAKFTEDQKPGVNKEASKRGTVAKGATRRKDVNWLDVARFEANVWYEAVSFPRNRGHISPHEFDVHLKAFESMYVAFINWYEYDFSFKALYFIWECAKKYSIDFVIHNLDSIEDPNKKNVDYIKTVIRNQHRSLMKQQLENERLCAKSYEIINTLVGLVVDKEPVDWDSLDEELDIEMKNKAEFDKVKLS